MSRMILRNGNWSYAWMVAFLFTSFSDLLVGCLLFLFTSEYCRDFSAAFPFIIFGSSLIAFIISDHLNYIMKFFT